MGLISALFFYKLGKRSVNKRIREQMRRDAMQPDFSDLDPESQDGIEARELYEDFLDRQAEEHMLLEEEKKEKETKEIAPPADGPWARFLKSLEQSHEATFKLLNKEIKPTDTKTPEGNQQ